MTQAIFMQVGDDLDYTPGADISAGQVVVLGSRVLVAKRAIASGDLGALSTRGLFKVVKDTSTFTAGAAVYWDEDGDPVDGDAGTGAATSSATGNEFMGIVSPDGAAATGDATVEVFLRSYNDSTLESLGVSDLSDVGAVAYTAGSVLVGDGDSYEEVAISGDATLAANGALTLAADEKNLTTAIADPGDAGAIPVTNTGYCPLVTEDAETRTLDAPTYCGQMLLLFMKTDGGDCVVTCATTLNETGNNTITFANTGEAVLLIGVDEGASKRWRIATADGATLSTV